MIMTAIQVHLFAIFTVLLSSHFSQAADDGSAGLQTGCPEGLLALRDFATP
jgi:hypothetical protein